CVSAPIIGREGLLRLVERAERLRARGLEGGGASWRARTWASSPHGGADESSGQGSVDVVSGGGPEGCSGVTGHAPGAVGGLGRASGGGDRGGGGRRGGRGAAGRVRGARAVLVR